MKILVLLLLVKIVYSLKEGANCSLMAPFQGTGKCISLFQCDYAMDLLQNHFYTKACGFKEDTALVCCPDIIQGSVCAVVEGTLASFREFPHMAALGYSTVNGTDWLCGGSLISENFVLTAAHCTKTKEYGSPKWARLGEIYLFGKEVPSAADFEINFICIHPSYKNISHYNDIALLRLKDKVDFKLNLNIQPACLHRKKTVSTATMQVAGWGRTDYLGPRSDNLMKTSVKLVDFKVCSDQYAKAKYKKLPRGIDNDTQICAGNESADTCSGDSGGPLQYKQPGHSFCQYVIVGVTSFGRGCGFKDSSGVYTRVSAFVPWIENILLLYT